MSEQHSGTPLEDLGLAYRVERPIRLEGINTVEALQEALDDDLRKIRRIGQSAMDEIHAAVEAWEKDERFVWPPPGTTSWEVTGGYVEAWGHEDAPTYGVHIDDMDGPAELTADQIKDLIVDLAGVLAAPHPYLD